MRSLYLVFYDSVQRESLRAKFFVFLRRMMSKFKVPDRCDDPNAPTTTAYLNAGGCSSGGFDITNMFYFRANITGVDYGDELSRYSQQSMPAGLAEGLTDGDGVLRFWMQHQKLYSNLAQVDFRIFAIPVSSASSERYFSVVNHILSPKRNRLSSLTLE